MIKFLMKYYYYGKDATVEITELAVSQNMKTISSSGKDTYRIVSQEAKKERNNSSWCTVLCSYV